MMLINFSAQPESYFLELKFGLTTQAIMGSKNVAVTKQNADQRGPWAFRRVRRVERGKGEHHEGHSAAIGPKPESEWPQIKDPCPRPLGWLWTACG